MESVHDFKIVHWDHEPFSKTPNIEHPTPTTYCIHRPSMLGVECSMFDVAGSWKASLELASKCLDNPSERLFW